MHLHLVRPADAAKRLPRPAKVIVLESRRQGRLEQSVRDRPLRPVA